MRRAVLILLFTFSFSFAYALDDIQGVNVVWNNFIASLRRGDYAAAHRLFSAQSRAVMPYRQFVAEYGPLSAAREMVLARPESQTTNLDGDWAEIEYAGAEAVSGQSFRVGVSLVKNGEVWGLVAARNENPERTEAGARKLLRLLRDNSMHGQPRDLVRALTAAQQSNPVLRRYRLETNGETFRAFPLDRSLRTFYVAKNGAVVAVEREPVVLERAVPAAPPVQTVAVDEPVRGGGDGMPEVQEPGDWTSVLPDDELPEPPMPGSFGVANPAFALPDHIE